MADATPTTRPRFAPCAECGKLIRLSASSRPPGVATCNPCRRARSDAIASLKARPGWDCVVCGVRVTRAKGPVTYCRLHKNLRPRSYQLKCATCEREFKTPHKKRKYCSDECRPQPKAKATILEWKQCGLPTCGAWLCKPGRRYCSPDHRREAGLWRIGCRDRKCSGCSQPLGWFNPKHLCDECRAKRKRERRARDRRNPNRSSQNNHRQRARHYGVEYEPIRRSVVYERDGWKCGICRTKVDKRLKHPHLMSATLDHIVPLARGGGHTYVNVQLAHMICNSRKSNTGHGDQLALIG